MSNDDMLIRVLLLLAVSLAAIAFAWRARLYNRRLAAVARNPAGAGVARAPEAPPPPIAPGKPLRDPQAE